jgi:hypothetical protein
MRRAYASGPGVPETDRNLGVPGGLRVLTSCAVISGGAAGRT